jgi:hypothetical protein
MTWHHVLIIGIAFFAVAYCGSKASCQPSLHDVIALATVVVSGTLGHAGGGKSQSQRKHEGGSDVR